ncbi:nitrate reductase [Marinobacterium jannaschii]|uniref:nitrate reductase n=1 Tax=Marinobacterium jannaschii TaxID=64970 RepID=UPI000488920A|nr:nitrate reductase [Marinobacterium jannaschii]
MNCKTTCPYCGVGCGVEADVRQGALQAVSGDKEHPANQGRLCVKGTALAQTLSAENRLLTPQVHGRPASWDDALNQVAAGFARTIEEHGPDSVAFYLSGQILTEDYYVANKLIKGFLGTANIDTNSRLCMASAVVGYKRAFGSDTVPCNYEDLEQADLLVLVGSNAAWNHPVLFQRMQAARLHNPDLKVVVIDPRRTATCELADLHLQIKPASDTLLFNGLLSYLAGHDKLDQYYIEQHTEGFGAALLEADRSAGDMQAVAQGCDLKLEDLHCFYRWFAAHNKTVTFYSQGINQSSSGVDNCNAIINCHLATGRIGRPGAGPFSITGQPNAMGGREVGGLANQLAAHMDFDQQESIDRVQRFWQAPSMAQQNGLKAVEMFQAIERGEIRAIWIMGTNPLVSLPDVTQVRRALQACPLVVVSDCVAATDTAAYADILLPATGWSEKDGTVTNSERRISRQRGLLPPMGEARHDWQIITEVARKMGFAEQFAYTAPFEVFREHAALSAFENNGSRDFDIGAFADIGAAEYESLTPVQWPVNAERPDGTARMFADGRFYTPSGRARFVTIKPRAALQQPDRQRPLILNSGRIRDQWHTMTRTGLSARLFQHRCEPFVEISAADAARRGIVDGQLVALGNAALGAASRFVGRACISEGQRVGELFVPMHWNRMFSSDGCMGTLLEPATDPLSGQPESKHGTVELTPLAEQWQGLLITRDIRPELATDYWARIPQPYSQAYRLAGKQHVADWPEYCRELLGTPDLTLEDPAAGQFRAAALEDGQLAWLLLILPFDQFPELGWLDSLFAGEQLDSDHLRYLLSATACDQPDSGAMVCSCFQVGSRAIEGAIAEGCSDVEALGDKLACGTNCGSCIPELQQLLRTTGD